MNQFQLEPARGRVPPSNLDAEAAVLSAIMLDTESLDIIRDVLRPEHMYADANRRILEAAYLLQDRGQPVDLVTVAGVLRDQGRLDQIGGTAYLGQIADATPAIANVDDHARIIRDKARLRRMIAVCQTSAAEGYGDISDACQWLDTVEQQVFDAAETENVIEHAETFADMAPVVLADMKAKRDNKGVAGIDTGWSDLNSMLNGWILGKLYILAGRPGMGKSGLALAACINVARTGKMAIFISAEMTRHELAMRALCLIAQVPIERAMSGYVTVDEVVRLTAAANELAKLPMVISERPGATIAQVRSDIRRKSSELRKRFGPEIELGMVAVDYLQIMNGLRQKGDSRENEVSALSKGLMWLAGELRCVVLALSQLSRECEKRPDKRPINSDLRESGGLEQDAYAIIFVYRDEYYNRDSEDRGVAEVAVSKHRNGKTGIVRMLFRGEWVEFATIDNRPEEVKQFDNFGDDPAENWDRG